MLIDRSESALVSRSAGHLMIYGRRKVGKTFLVKNALRPHIYILVKRGGGMHLEGAPFDTLDSYAQLMHLVPEWLREGKVVAIDEFQRLPPDFPDMIQTFEGDGRLILTGSSFHVVKELISPGSPVLGLLQDLRLSMISPVDIFRGLAKAGNNTEAFGLSPFLRDPWLIPYFRFGKTTMADLLLLTRGAVRSLLGEVFLEEEKRLSQVYEGVIRALALGKWKLAQISDLMNSRGVADGAGPHQMRPYFNTMEEMDLVRRVPVYGKKEFKYMISSPIMDLAFRLDEKYGFFHRDISVAALKHEVDESVPHHVERFCGEYFAQVYDGRYEFFYSRDMDIDFIITRGKRVLASGEVKWKDKVERADVDRFLERTRHLQGDKIFFSKRKVRDDRVISLTPLNLLKWTDGMMERAAK